MTASVAELERYAPRRPRPPKMPPQVPEPPIPSTALLGRAVQVVRESGVVEWLEPRLPEALRRASGASPGGRAREMTLDALLVGMLVVAMQGRPMFVRNVHRALDGLTPRDRKRVRLPPDRAITERMVSRLFNQVSDALDPSPYAAVNAWMRDPEAVRERLGLPVDALIDEEALARVSEGFLAAREDLLDEFVWRLLRATHPSELIHSGDFATDSSKVASWESGTSPFRRGRVVLDDGTVVRQTINRAAVLDPDADWWVKKNDGPVARHGSNANKPDYGLGFQLTAYTRVEQFAGIGVEPAPVPRLIEHLNVVSAREPGVKTAGELMERMVTHHEADDVAAGRNHRPRGDILADREYTLSADWHAHMHELGFEPVFQLKEFQRTTKVLASGVVVVDGIPYSPGLPEELRTSIKPKVFATRHDYARDAQLMEPREAYRIKAYGGGRQDDGSIKAYCGASNLAGHALRCENKPASLPGRIDRVEVGTALPVIVSPDKPTICRQSSVTIPFDELPYWQRYAPGSPEHQQSFHRRSNIESVFSRLEDSATQSYQRGNIRLFGRARMTIMLTFLAMAGNLLEVDRWRARLAAPALKLVAPKKKRVPRRHTVARDELRALRQELVERAALIEEFRVEGLLLDPDTGEVRPAGNAPGP